MPQEIKIKPPATRRSLLPYEFVVGFVRAYPKPSDSIAVHYAHDTIMVAHAHAPSGFPQWLKIQRGMPRVGPPQEIILPGKLLDVPGQQGKLLVELAAAEGLEGIHGKPGMHSPRLSSSSASSPSWHSGPPVAMSSRSCASHSALSAASASSAASMSASSHFSAKVSLGRNCVLISSTSVMMPARYPDAGEKQSFF